MDLAKIIRGARRLSRPYRVHDGRKFRLKDFDPAVPPGLSSKDRATEVLPAGLCRLTELQDKLYAADRWALLVIFQAMNAAG